MRRVSVVFRAELFGHCRVRFCGGMFFGWSIQPSFKGQLVDNMLTLGLEPLVGVARCRVGGQTMMRGLDVLAARVLFIRSAAGLGDFE